MELQARQIKESDWGTLCSWWKWWRWPNMQKDMLPEDGTGGVMIEKNGIPIVVGFVYTSNSKTIFLDWIVSNPEYRESDRGEAIDMLITVIELTFKNLGYKYVVTIGRNKSLIETHKRLGYNVDERKSYELIKKL